MKKLIERILFNTRWLLIPFYLVLVLMLGVYLYFDIREFVIFIIHIGILDRDTAMLTFLQMIDMAMIANLGKMIITGSYNSFVSKDHGYKGENISSGLLKVKMASSLVGVTAISILQKGLDVQTVSWDTLYKLSFVHAIFLISAAILVFVYWLHSKTEKLEHEDEQEENDYENKCYSARITHFDTVKNELPF